MTVNLERNHQGREQPGPWWRPAVRDDWSRTATLCCPNGHVAYLDGHKIDEAGNVSPSIVCPVEDCEWHVEAHLAGWAL